MAVHAGNIGDCLESMICFPLRLVPAHRITSAFQDSSLDVKALKMIEKYGWNDVWWLSQIPFPRTPILIYSWASSKLGPGLHIHGGVQVEWWPYGIFQSRILLRTSDHHHVKWCRIPSKRSLRTRTFTETSSCPDIRPNLNIVMGRWGAQVCSIIRHRRRFQNQNNAFSGHAAWLLYIVLIYCHMLSLSVFLHSTMLNAKHQDTKSLHVKTPAFDYPLWIVLVDVHQAIDSRDTRAIAALAKEGTTLNWGSLEILKESLLLSMQCKSVQRSRYDHCFSGCRRRQKGNGIPGRISCHSAWVGLWE